jgi:hypothetical protein
VMEPRHGERGEREESPPGGGAGKADGLHAPEGRSPGRVRALQAFTAQVRALTGRPSGPIVQARRPRRLGWWAGEYSEVPPYPESAVSIEWPFSVRDGTESPSVVLCLTHRSAWSRSQLATACGRGCSRNQGHRERQWIGCREHSRVAGRGVSRGAEVMTTASAPMYQWHSMSWTKIER